MALRASKVCDRELSGLLDSPAGVGDVGEAVVLDVSNRSEQLIRGFPPT